MTKRYLVLFGTAAVVLFGFLMATVDFQVARTANNTNTHFVRVISHQNDETPNLNKVYLHLEERTGVNGVLGWELRKELQETGKFDVHLLNNEPGPNELPVLVVGVRNVELFWTPIYAKSSMQAVGKYASYATDMTLENVNLSTDDSVEGLAVGMTLEVTSQVRSIGIISRPSHLRTLVRKAAEDMVEYMRTNIDEVRAKQVN